MALGEKLCNARLARKESLSDVAAATRMKVQLVEAIEKEDFRRVAAPIYAKGFIRLYAEHVGLDPRPLVEEYVERFGGHAPDRRPPSRLQDGQPRVTKILQRSPGAAETEPPAPGTEPPVEADLFDLAPPAPERGAPRVPRFEKETQPVAARPSINVAETLRGAVATVSSVSGRAARRLRSLTSIRPAAAHLLATPAARIAVGVAAVLIVAFVVSSLNRCSAPQHPPAGTPGTTPAAEAVELAVDPPPVYVD